MNVHKGVLKHISLYTRVYMCPYDERFVKAVYC